MNLLTNISLTIYFIVVRFAQEFIESCVEPRIDNDNDIDNDNNNY